MSKLKLKLSFVIVSMTVMIVLATSSVSIWSSYRNFNDILMQNKIVMQENYVREVSIITESYVQEKQREPNQDKSIEPYMVQVVDKLLDERVVSFSAFIKSILMPLLLWLVTILVLAVWLAFKIARPLKQLFISVEKEEVQKLEEINDWYYEAHSLKKVVQNMVISSESTIFDLTNQLNLDALTGIPNRGRMDQILNELIINKVPHTIVLIDLDDFKSINDTYGHTVGDEVLKAFASHMQENIEKQGMCFRYGGEEFMVILPSTTIDVAIELAENLRIKQAMLDTACERPVTMSAGITSFTANIKTANQIITIADQALYKAKQSGRNCICVFEELSEKIIK
ncbi:signaling membrane protein [Lysinibacillus xylanilyticus]|uniref:Signaling membrane protein n=1 Tax=Lysinibacillus xylanilyticus TaxID=582475 RepID=A0A0K9F8L8_9BACI|nr:GGDEF domain-containing protein [Lysinibacillus xylanilyticus]KMY30860.1 signaling membrane protein [Lysinibacillus xylanilyticus]